ncbi:MAG: 2-dehydropantoate 2-reductase [Polyangiaceae bacterium]|nr:2-dehydropantoate 2-reductase [Polyangiaceae bacterium]
MGDPEGQRLRALIVGTGAVGGWFGGRLALAGHDVTVVARGANAAAIEGGGLRLVQGERVEIARPRVVRDTREARGLGADVAWICVKAWQLGEVAEATGEALAPGGVAVPLLNGLDSERALAGALGAARVVGGVAQLNAALAAPGEVRLAGGGAVTLAPLPGGPLEPVRALAERVSDAFPCHVDADLDRLLWWKLLWNAPFNAVCALTGLAAGPVLADPALERLVRGVMGEVIAVAAAEGVSLATDAPDAMIEVTRAALGDSEPSMLHDVRAGRRTEVDALQGAVVARGARHAIPTPLTEALRALVAARAYGPPPG